MSTTFDIKEIMNRWRRGVKLKFRGAAQRSHFIEMRMDDIEAHVHPQRINLDDWEIRECFIREIGEIEYIDSEWRPFRIGDTWGGVGRSAFMRRLVKMPDEFAGNKVVMRMYIGGDALLKVNGKPWHAIDPFHYDIVLTDKAKGGETFDLQVESYVSYHAEKRFPHEFAVCELMTVDEEIEAVFYDFLAVQKALLIKNADSRLEEFLETNLWEAIKLIPDQCDNQEEFRTAAAEAKRKLKETVYDSASFKDEGLMHFIGHSHLDVVFMWPYREFVRKIARTHSTVLRLMEQYPYFRFSQSQAKIYADMKKHYPDMFEAVKKRINEGRWEPIGAFWVEPDCNLISGESFVRQIMYGQKFFEREFGMRSRSCWQPDVFGLSWAMPQILARSNIEFFLTNKMVVWNDTNDWTVNNFWWEGPDGSRVFAIVPPGHFIGTVDPDVMDEQWRNFSDKRTIGETLHVYGWGDGGSGPDPEMIECTQRYKDFPGLIPTRISSAEEAFQSVRDKALRANPPVLRDELYLEEHRGTFTTKAIFKKLNRRMEHLLRDAELVGALAMIAGNDYSAADIDEAWETLLTTQFHDSLPGTHVNEAHADMLADYAKIEKLAGGVLEAAAEKLFGAGEGAGLLVFNTMLHGRGGYCLIPANLTDGMKPADGGSVLPQQAVTALNGEKSVLVDLPELPSVGYRILELSNKDGDLESKVSAGKRTLENELLRAEFNERGELTRLYDKEHDREILVKGLAGNRLRMYEDRPGRYEAWDIAEAYKELEVDISGESSIRIDETGPIRASLLVTRKIGSSSLRQRISLCANSRLLAFETEIDWFERQRLLRVGFPVEINTLKATYDIAYGNMERANHRNTPYDAAKFEVPAHQWMDMSQADYGVSLLNDSKYGHEADGKWIKLTLLKGSTHPDPESDRELHHFTYALYPHSGGWREAGTNTAALELNERVIARRSSGEIGAEHSYISCSSPAVTLEAFKPAEDGKGMILRLVERHNTNVRGTLEFDHPVGSAWKCNLMEENETELETDGNKALFTAGPYEIVTIRLTR